jgi:hypothetical protein
MIYSPNVIYPYGITYVYQGGHEIRSWAHVAPYEIPLAVVGGTVRQSSLENLGSEYTLAGVPTGKRYSIVPNVYDAASDGNSIFGWNVVTASLLRYDLNWHFQQSVFSLGAGYDHAYMGITYDPQNNSIWLSPLSTGSIVTKGSLYNYSMDGALLRTLSLANRSATSSGLAYDPADNTLWCFNWSDQRFEQYSKSGDLLNTMSGMTRIYGAEFAIVPEPSVLAFLGMATLLFRVRKVHRISSKRL